MRVCVERWEGSTRWRALPPRGHPPPCGRTMPARTAAPAFGSRGQSAWSGRRQHGHADVRKVTVRHFVIAQRQHVLLPLLSGSGDRLTHSGIRRSLHFASWYQLRFSRYKGIFSFDVSAEFSVKTSVLKHGHLLPLLFGFRVQRKGSGFTRKLATSAGVEQIQPTTPSSQRWGEGERERHVRARERGGQREREREKERARE